MIYRVDLSGYLYVEADDEYDAREVAEDLLDPNGFDLKPTAVTEVVSEEDVPLEWASAIPFGGKGDKTIRERLKGTP